MRKLRSWGRGYSVTAPGLYGFDRRPRHEYLSDYAAGYRTWHLNPDRFFFDHKAAQRGLLLAAGLPQIETVALVWRERVVLHAFTPRAESITSEELAEWLVQDGGEFVLKPELGYRGRSVWLVSVRGGELVGRRGREERPFRFSEWRSGLTLVERRAEQAEFWAGLYPHTLNTIRVLTLWSSSAKHPVVARAAQRIGMSESIPCDNFNQGGIAASIDLATGRLGKGRRLREPRRFLTHHPESGATIEGATLPAWDEVKRSALRAASSAPMNSYLGWDLFVDRTGTPVVQEANCISGVHVLQLDSGLLADPMIRRYFAEHGVT